MSHVRRRGAVGESGHSGMSVVTFKALERAMGDSSALKRVDVPKGESRGVLVLEVLPALRSSECTLS